MNAAYYDNFGTTRPHLASVLFRNRYDGGQKLLLFAYNQSNIQAVLSGFSFAYLQLGIRHLLRVFSRGVFFAQVQRVCALIVFPFQSLSIVLGVFSLYRGFSSPMRHLSGVYRTYSLNSNHWVWFYLYYNQSMVLLAYIYYIVSYRYDTAIEIISQERRIAS